MILERALYYTLSHGLWKVLALIMFLSGIAVAAGGYLASFSVFPTNLLTYVVDTAILFLISLFLFYQARYIAEDIGYNFSSERESLRIVKIFIFLLFLSLATYVFVVSGYWYLALVILLLTYFYPVAVALDDISPFDNLFSTTKVLLNNLSEFLLLLLTGLIVTLFLYVVETVVGPLLSFLLAIIFFLPFLVSMMVLVYLRTYPIIRKID